jgi:hypothetical protein
MEPKVLEAEIKHGWHPVDHESPGLLAVVIVKASLNNVIGN